MLNWVFLVVVLVVVDDNVVFVVTLVVVVVKKFKNDHFRKKSFSNVDIFL